MKSGAVLSVFSLPKFSLLKADPLSYLRRLCDLLTFNVKFMFICPLLKADYRGFNIIYIKMIYMDYYVCMYACSGVCVCSCGCSSYVYIL